MLTNNIINLHIGHDRTYQARTFYIFQVSKGGCNSFVRLELSIPKVPTEDRSVVAWMAGCIVTETDAGRAVMKTPATSATTFVYRGAANPDRDHTL